MSTMLNTQDSQTPKANPQGNVSQQSTPSGSSFGMYFGPNLAGALNLVMAVLAKTEVVLEQDQRNLQKEIIQNSSKIAIAARSSTISAGHLAFIDGLATGLGQIVGGVASIGTIVGSEVVAARNSDLKEVNKEQEGVQKYQKALEESTPEKSVTEKSTETKEEQKVEDKGSKQEVDREAKKQEAAERTTEETVEDKDAVEETTSKAEREHNEKIKQRLKALIERDSFANVDPANETAFEIQTEDEAEPRQVTDREMFDHLTDPERQELSAALKDRAKTLAEKKASIANALSSRRQMISTIASNGQSILSGSGTAVAASTKVDQAVDNANAQLNQSTYQNMNQIEQTQQNIGDQELQAAQKFIEVLTAISNGDRYQG